MTRPLLALALALHLILPACGTSGRGGDETRAPAARAEKLAGDWTLTGLEGKPPTLPDRSLAPSMTIGTDWKAGGRAGVNRWSATLDGAKAGAGEFSLSRPTTTLMAGPPAAMELERRFLGALERVRRFDPAALEKGELSLLDGAGVEVLRFRRGASGAW